MLFPLLILGFAMNWAVGTAEAADSTDEEDLKISYILKFPQFVEWPKSSLPDADGTFDICVVSGDELTSISEALDGKQIRLKRIVVMDARRTNSIANCRVLYIGKSESWRVRSILAQIGDKPILTISDAENFAQEGGIVGLVKRDNHLKFEINLKRAKQAGLYIPAQLAQLATKAF
jgi:hypothetical protein